MSETLTTYGIGPDKHADELQALRDERDRLREELWTVKVGKRIAKLKRTREQIAGLAALAEHARAVRVVKATRKSTPSEPCEAWKDGYMTACDDILEKLQKGRA